MQIDLFGELVPIGLSIEKAAETAQVSTATIRNWIKTGYLKQLKRGVVSDDSLQLFMTNVAGTEKLNSRANKSKKDDHDHPALTGVLSGLMRQLEGEQLAEVYEASLSDSHRNKEGIYYTPSWIIEDLLQEIPITSSTKFLDPCCGSGNFLIEAIRKGVSPHNIYGYDTDSNAVEITKDRILKETGVEAENVTVGDFLATAHSLASGGTHFDLIFTNPPWGKKLEKGEREQYARIYGAGKSLDTTALFLMASLCVLSEGGYLGFLNQEAFFNISTFEDVRKKILDKDISRLVDYGKAFKGLLTRAQAIVVKNERSTNALKTDCSFEGKSFFRDPRTFASNPKSILNFWADDTDALVIERLYSLPHKTLGGEAQWALGIVTGNNTRFFSDTPKAGYVPVYKGSDIGKTGLKDPTIYIPDDFSLYQQVAPIELYQAKEKLIYRFISSNLVFFTDTEQRYILNSANLVIPDASLGVPLIQLAKLLNSELMNWLFQKLFNTHKVLRGDIEVLPIHIEYLKQNPDFSEVGYLEYLGLIKEKNGAYRIKDQNC